jgi:hypothetical protein
MFPADLPGFEATWWPVTMETVPGSGEAITVAIIARAASGQASVRTVLDPATLNGMFGHTHAKGLHWMISTTVLQAQKALDAGTPVEQLDFAFGGFHRLHARDCVAHHIDEVFDQAVAMSSGFVDSPWGRPDESEEAGPDALHEWAAGVREALFAARGMDLRDEQFNVKVKLHNKMVAFGLLRVPYAANFGVLRPGNASTDIRTLKVKVFDLGSLRNDPSLGVERFDVLMGCPPSNALTAFSRREVDSFHQAVEYIQFEARARNVNIVRCAQHAAAAAHIARAIAA